MKILFIEVDTETSWALASVGPAYLAPVLVEAGHEVDFYRARFDTDTATVVAEVRARAPDLIGLSLTTRQWLRAKALVAAIRATLDVPIVAGGLHPTFSPVDVLQTPGFDFVCLGEGEGGLVDLVTALEAGAYTGAIENIWAQDLPKPNMRPPVPNLDALPFADRRFLDEQYGVINLSTQRGCPFPCTYCAARMYGELYRDSGAGRYTGRRRSPDSVIAELKQIRADGPLNYVIFLDDTFTTMPRWVREFCPRYTEEIGVPFSINARVETVNPEVLKILADGGCKHIIYGVESGSERVRRDILKRPVAEPLIRQVFEQTKAAGIMVTANYMLALPGETYAEVEETLALAESLGAYDFGYFVFYPYPGTHLYRTCEAEGALPDDYLSRPANHRASILNLKDLTQPQIGELYDRFTALRERTHIAHRGAHVTHATAAQIKAEMRRHAETA